MAIAAAAVWEIRSTATASNVNGGFFKTGASGVDYSQQDAAQYNLTGVTTAGLDAILLDANAAADMVGNAAHIISGTNFTAGWYEVISVVVGVSITLDRNCTSAAGAIGVVNIGGAISLGAANDDAVFEASEAGNTYHIKAGTYTMAGAITIAKAATAAAPIKIIGYQTTRGDAPTGTNRPLLDGGSTHKITLGAYWQMENVQFTTSVAGVAITCNNFNVILNCRFVNKHATAAQICCFCSNSTVINTEAICYRGYAFYMAGGTLVGCYAHSSNYGVYVAGDFSLVMTDSVISDCVTSGVYFNTTLTFVSIIARNTFYGFASKVGSAVELVAGANAGTRLLVFNNIFYGYTTALKYGTAIACAPVSYNNFYNNTTDVTNVTKVYENIALDPAFTSVTDITGTNGTVSALILTSSGANFDSVVAGQDYLYIVSGTGATAGIYGVTSKTTTTLTLDIAPGDSAVADKVYKIVTGRVFTVGTAMKAVGFPDTQPGPLGIAYNDLGALQTQYGTGAAAGGGSTGFPTYTI